MALIVLHFNSLRTEAVSSYAGSIALYSLLLLPNNVLLLVVTIHLVTIIAVLFKQVSNENFLLQIVAGLGFQFMSKLLVISVFVFVPVESRCHNFSESRASQVKDVYGI